MQDHHAIVAWFTQEQALLPATIPTIPYSILCAWCLAAQGITSQDGSHGICPFHAELLLQAHHERQQQRKEAQP